MPRDPVTIAIEGSGRSDTWSRSLAELIPGKSVHIRIPTAEISFRGDVRSLKFNVAESKYNHGDTLDLFMDRVVLTRYATAAIIDFTPENAVLFPEAKVLPVRLEFAGTKRGTDVEVLFDLARSGNRIASRSERLTRGTHRLVLPLDGPLPPGVYRLTATASGVELASASVRMVSSPFQ